MYKKLSSTRKHINNVLQLLNLAERYGIDIVDVQNLSYTDIITRIVSIVHEETHEDNGKKEIQMLLKKLTQ